MEPLKETVWKVTLDQNGENNLGLLTKASAVKWTNNKY